MKRLAPLLVMVLHIDGIIQFDPAAARVFVSHISASKIKMPVFPKGSGSLIYENGRDDRIRTCGLIVPNDARYQTVPHPDNDMYSINF